MVFFAFSWVRKHSAALGGGAAVKYFTRPGEYSYAAAMPPPGRGVSASAALCQSSRAVSARSTSAPPSQELAASPASSPKRSSVGVS